MSDTVVTLKSSGRLWVLLAPKGHILYELSPRTTSREAAYDEAVLWASSWSGMVVKFEDEQDTKRD